MSHISELLRVADYLLDKYTRTSRAVVITGRPAPRLCDQVIHTRRVITKAEHDKILALWKTGSVTRRELQERFKQSYTTVWKVTVGLHIHSHEKHKQTPRSV